MHDDQQTSLERALAKTESDADAVLKAASAVTVSLKRFRAAAQVGNLRELRPAITAAEQAIVALRQQFANAKEGWDFDEDAYFANGAFPRELLETAERLGLRIFEQDDRLYCYPALIRVLPSERSVLIDKVRERRLRPSVLVNHLKDLQRRPARFKPEAFLEALFSAYVISIQQRPRDLFGQGVVGKPRSRRQVDRVGEGGDPFGQGRVVKLLEIYDLLTLLPGQTREYSRQEFARDIYLLDRSGVTTTKKGQIVSFPASTGAKGLGSTVKVITERGQEKVYYGICFTGAG